MEKITYVAALTSAIESGVLSAEIVEKLTALRSQMVKKASTPSVHKMTATQKENESLKTAILGNMADGVAYTISELMKLVPELDGLSNQRVSAIVRQLKVDEMVTREDVKGKAYFTKA